MASSDKSDKSKLEQAIAAAAQTAQQAAAAPASAAMQPKAAPAVIEKEITLRLRITVRGRQAAPENFEAFALQAVCDALAASAPQSGLEYTVSGGEDHDVSAEEADLAHA